MQKMHGLKRNNSGWTPATGSCFNLNYTRKGGLYTVQLISVHLQKRIQYFSYHFTKCCEWQYCSLSFITGHFFSRFPSFALFFICCVDRIATIFNTERYSMYETYTVVVIFSSTQFVQLLCYKTEVDVIKHSSDILFDRWPTGACGTKASPYIHIFRGEFHPDLIFGVFRAFPSMAHLIAFFKQIYPETCFLKHKNDSEKVLDVYNRPSYMGLKQN